MSDEVTADDRLASIDLKLDGIEAELSGTRRSSNRRLVATLAVVVLLALAGVNDIAGRNEARAEARCRDLTAQVEEHAAILASLRRSFGESPELDDLEAALLDVDARTAQNVPESCPAADLFTRCVDGTYSTSSGPGTCSHHGGIASTTTEPED